MLIYHVHGKVHMNMVFWNQIVELVWGLNEVIDTSTGDGNTVMLWGCSKQKFGSCQECILWLGVGLQMFCQMFNWFTFFCIVRTFSNCLETVLTTMALFYWWPVQSPSTDHHHTGSIFTSRQLGLLLAGVACIIRPTSAIIWVYVGVVQLLKIQHKLQFLLSEVFPIGYKQIFWAIFCSSCW